VCTSTVCSSSKTCVAFVSSLVVGAFSLNVSAETPLLLLFVPRHHPRHHRPLFITAPLALGQRTHEMSVRCIQDLSFSVMLLRDVSLFTMSS
jgi:hypothetical protein